MSAEKFSSQKGITAVILAAGKGVRMRSGLPKVLHRLYGRSLLGWVVQAVVGVPRIKKVVLVLNRTTLAYQDLLREELSSRLSCDIVVQEKPLGSGHALKVALDKGGITSPHLLVLCGDSPLLTSSSLRRLVSFHMGKDNACSILTASTEEPAGYGRIHRDKEGNIDRIIEEADTDVMSRKIGEINSGVYCFKTALLGSRLARLKANNLKREYYLTDLVGILCRQGLLIKGTWADNPCEALGVNTRQDLMAASMVLRERILNRHLKAGVTIVDPATTFIEADVAIGQDTVIYPFTVINKGVRIGRSCSVGPFCHLRNGSRIKDHTQVGNFTEVNRSILGSRVLMKHFGYLGDARVGPGVNIGAGTVTANYDGLKKHITRIGAGAFIGSDTILIAPVKVGKNAKTGAGAVVLRNRDVPAGKVVAGVPARAIRKKA